MNIEHIDLSKLDLSNGFTLPEDALPQGVALDPTDMAQTFKGFIERLGLPIEDVILVLPGNTFASAIDGIVQAPKEITLDDAFIELAPAALANIGLAFAEPLTVALGEREGVFSGAIMVSPGELLDSCKLLALRILDRGLQVLNEDEGEQLRHNLAATVFFLSRQEARAFASNTPFQMHFGVETLAMFTGMWDELAHDAISGIPPFLHEMCELATEFDMLMESNPVRYGHLLGEDE